MRKVVKVNISMNAVSTINNMNISVSDMKRLRELGFVNTDPETHQVAWTAPKYARAGVYKNLKTLCKQGRVYNFGGHVIYGTAVIK